MHRFWGPAVLACALLLGGCSGSGSTSDSAVDAGSGGNAPVSGEKAAEGTTGSLTADADRQVVVTGKVGLSVEDPLAAVAEVARLVESTGGHIQERYETAARDGADASASVVARIPADQVTSTLDRLAEIGEVLDSSLSSTEVTAQARDLDARIHALEISIGRLEDLLKRAGSVSDVVAAEQVLTDRQSQLEQLQSQRAALAEQVAMSTITITLWPNGSVPSEPPTGFMSGLSSGWNALAALGHGLLVLLGVLLPWLALAGLLTAVAVPVTRWLRRRSAAKAPRSAPTGPAPWPAAPFAMAPYPGGPPGPGAPPIPPAAAPSAPPSVAPSVAPSVSPITPDAPVPAANDAPQPPLDE